MNLEELKVRFRHKMKADLKDIDLALEAVPMLVREVERLEKELVKAEARIQHLSRKRPPLVKKGQKGKAAWEAQVDEENNRLYIKLSGSFEPLSAKLASNQIVSMLSILRDGFDVINDVTELNVSVDKKVLFHIRKVWYSLGKSGMNRSIRIVSEASQSASHLFDKLSGKQEKAEKVATMKEAEGLLENVGRHLKA